MNHPPQPQSPPSEADDGLTETSLSSRENEQQGCANKGMCVEQLAREFESAFTELHIVPPSHLRDMAAFVCECMSHPNRNYHDVQHIHTFLQSRVCGVELDALARLSVLFHDVVYLNVDGSLSKAQRKRLPLSIRESNGQVFVDSVDQDPLLRMVLRVFGYQVGLLPASGQNEFMSAVIAVRELRNLLCLKDLAHVAVCIEATIPFRPIENGVTSMDRLYERLVGLSQEFELSLSDADCIQSVQRAVVVANEDIGNFSTTDHAYFLDVTWSLLPETNEPLRDGGLYSINDFHCAMFKLSKLFNFLKPELLFREFRGVPEPATFRQITNRSAVNIEIGRQYVGAKLIGLSFLAAVAELTGGDAPIHLFMGDLKPNSKRLEDRLVMPDTIHPDAHDEVYRLLVKGRKKETCFDIRRSPLSAYFYSLIGDKEMKSIFSKNGSLFPMTSDTAKQFLTTLPREAVTHVTVHLADMFDKRRDRILEVLRELPCEA